MQNNSQNQEIKDKIQKLNEARDYPALENFYKEEIAKGNVELKYPLGVFYYKGRKYLEAIKILESIEIGKNRKIYYYLGEIYAKLRNKKKSQEYFAKGEEEGNTLCIQKRAVAALKYYQYIQIEKTKEIFKQVLNKLQNLDSNKVEILPEVYHCLGLMYLNGLGVEKNIETAYQNFQKGEQVKNKECLTEIGKLHFHGELGTVDYQKAKEYFELAMKMNDPAAIYMLGEMHLQGLIFESNIEKAKEYYEIADLKGDRDATLRLGELYLSGQGVEKDLEKARLYFEKLNDQYRYLDNTSKDLIQKYLFSIYKDTKETFKLIKFLENGCEQRREFAIRNLGGFYLEGRYGLPKDLNKAIEIFSKGNSDTSKRLLKSAQSLLKKVV